MQVASLTHKILSELTFKGYKSTRTKRWAGAIEFGKQGSRVVVIHLKDSKSWIWSQGWVQPASVHYRILQRPSHWQYQLPLRLRLKTKNSFPIVAYWPHLTHLTDERFYPLEGVKQSVSGLVDSRDFESRKLLLKTNDTGTVVFNLWTQDSSSYSDWEYFLN